MAEENVTKIKNNTKESVKKQTIVKDKLPEAVEVVKRASKFELPIFNLAGQEVGEITLPKSVFGLEINVALITQALRVYQANSHQGTRSTKTRAEVRGGGRKPWRQKGTGRARQGSIRSPQWRGGGIAFGPKPVDLTLDLPTKMKRAALKSALSSKLSDVIVVDSFKLKDVKTKEVIKSLKNLRISGKTLFVLPETDKDMVLAGRNIKDLSIALAQDLNAFQVLLAKKLVFAKDAVQKLEEVGK